MARFAVDRARRTRRRRAARPCRPRAGRRQACRDRLQQLVAGFVAERVVDVLELVEIDEQHGAGVAVAAAARQQLLDAVADQRPVGQPGQAVMQRLVAQLAGLDADQAPRPARDRSRARTPKPPSSTLNAITGDQQRPRPAVREQAGRRAVRKTCAPSNRCAGRSRPIERLARLCRRGTRRSTTRRDS